MRTQLLIATTLLAATGSSALADSNMEVGAFVGMHLWNDDNDLGSSSKGPREVLDNSPIFGIRIGRRLTQSVTAEGELGLSPAKTDGTATDVVGIGYRLHVLVHPKRFADDRLEPFALLGLGGMSAASSDSGAFRNDAEIEAHAGVGLKVRFGRDWGLRLDARLIVPPARGGGATTDGELLVAVYKTFPPKPAPAPAPIMVVPQPPPPEPTATDKDADGVVDAQDQCLDQPEDRDGYTDEDGCPDPDNDSDGVLDGVDHCPAQTETKNGFQDDDGCPDEAPAAVKQFTGVIRGIDFATASDQLTPGSSKTLDEAVKVLTDYPTLRLEVSGHTDSTGDAGFNRELSRRRAESVKTYLVGHGIAADRIETTGHGPDQPIADNATAEGRAKNRRVEFAVR
jgi:OOP family OmpA-OmpF porin